jgi:hypothetical protein
MDRNSPPDDDFDARQLEAQRTDELVSSEADGIAQHGVPWPLLLDPKTLVTLGTFGIGFVLAARIQEFGPFKFNEGIPSELADVLRACFKPPSGGDAAS